MGEPRQASLWFSSTPHNENSKRIKNRFRGQEACPRNPRAVISTIITLSYIVAGKQDKLYVVFSHPFTIFRKKRK